MKKKFKDNQAFIFKYVIPVVVIVVMSLALWLHWEAISSNIFIDYGIEPLNLTEGCEVK